MKLYELTQNVFAGPVTGTVGDRFYLDEEWAEKLSKWIKLVKKPGKPKPTQQAQHRDEVQLEEEVPGAPPDDTGAAGDVQEGGEPKKGQERAASQSKTKRGKGK